MSDSFLDFNTKVIVPFAMTLMIGGLIFLCQPWFELLHAYSVTITLIGLILFTIFARFGPSDKKGGH